MQVNDPKRPHVANWIVPSMKSDYLKFIKNYSILLLDIIIFYY